MANLPFASGSKPPSAGLTPQLTWSAAIDPTMLHSSVIGALTSFAINAANRSTVAP
jgi:hypothetical protein